MEESEGIGSGENGSSSEGRPPNPFTASYRKYLTNDPLVAPCKKSLIRHASLVSLYIIIYIIFEWLLELSIPLFNWWMCLT